MTDIERVAMAICGAGTQYPCVCLRDARPPATCAGTRCQEAMLEAVAAMRVRLGWTDRTINWACNAFKTEVENMLDDPSYMLHPLRDEEPAETITAMRGIAEDLGLDFNALIIELGSDYEINRFRQIESGEQQPAPREVPQKPLTGPTVFINGWRVGMNKIGVTKLLHACGIGVAEAHRFTNQIVNSFQKDKEDETRFDDGPVIMIQVAEVIGRDEFIGKLRDLGVLIE